jgi:hypothetical protein
MTDRREALLNQLVTIAAAQPLISLAGRNYFDPPDKLLPAAMVFEGDEEIDERDQSLGRSGQIPNRVHMVPYIMVTAMAPPGNIVQVGGTNIWADNLGPKLSAIRVGLVKAVLTDATLASIYGTNGRVLYKGMASEIVPGRSTIGRVSLNFQITYPLKSTEL